MKRLAYYTVCLLTVLVLATTVNAKDNSKVKNLKAGITSNNEGLKKSSIYMAGKYKISEATSELTSELKSTDDNNVKILIALSLLRINESGSMNEVRTAALNENDIKTKRMLTAIYNEYVTGTGNMTASINY